MLINKITTGFVVQVFDTEQGRFISQEFIASDQVDYESDGDPVDPPAEIMQASLPYHMYQPLLTYNISNVGILSEVRKKTYVDHPDRCPYCGSDLIFSEQDRQVGKWIVQKTGCYGCSKSWHDIYILTNIEEQP